MPGGSAHTARRIWRCVCLSFWLKTVYADFLSLSIGFCRHTTTLEPSVRGPELRIFR
jgi:hypothetical protein